MTKNDFLAAVKDDLRETPLLYYVSGYKYQSRNAMIYQTFIYPEQDIITELIVLRRDGWMWVAAFFSWDGCSGIAIDTDTNMRGGHAHDALAALMRMGRLPIECRFKSNDLIRRLMIDDGAWGFRARGYEWTLDKMKFWAEPEHARKMKVAPHNIKMADGCPA